MINETIEEISKLIHTPNVISKDQKLKEYIENNRDLFEDKLDYETWDLTKKYIEFFHQPNDYLEHYEKAKEGHTIAAKYLKQKYEEASQYSKENFWHENMDPQVFLDAGELRWNNSREAYDEQDRILENFKKIVTKWNNEQQTKNAKGDGSQAIEAWKLPSWLIQKNALSADEKGYVHIYKIERETSKAYLVQLIKDYTPSLAKAILGGGVEWAKHTSKEWIPKSQIEERIPVLSQEKK